MKKRGSRIAAAALVTIMTAATVLTGCGGGSAKTETPKETTKAPAEAPKDTAEAPKDTTEAPKAGTEAAGGEAKKVCVVFNTNLGDKSFSDLVWNGVQKAQNDFGIETKAIELMGDATKQEPTLMELCESEEWDLIVAGTFNLKEAIEKVAAEFPEQKFLVYDTEIDFAKGDYKNCHSVMCKQNEGAFLGGALAALMTTSGEEGFNDSNVIGFVGGGENSAIDDFLVGYIEGAKYVSSDCSVLFSFVGDFKNTAKAKELAIAQYNQNADVVFQVASSAGLGVLDAAKQENKFAIGVDQDQASLMAESDDVLASHIMTSVVKNLDTIVYNKIADFLNDKIQWGTHENAGLKEDGMALADNEYLRKIVPEDTLKQIDDIKGKIVSGEIVVKSAIGMGTDDLNKIKESAK